MSKDVGDETGGAADRQRVDRLVASDAFGTDAARRVAQALAARHADGRMSEGRDLPDVERIARDDVAAFEEIAHFAPELATAELHRVIRLHPETLLHRAERLRARASASRILAAAIPLDLSECWVESDRSVRIETRRRAPAGDVCLELAGLAVAMLAAGRADAAEALIAHYAGLTDDFDLYALLDAYELHVALARAAEAARSVAHAAHHEAREAATALTRRLVAVALGSDRRTRSPALVVAVGGQVASGKSTFARALSDELSVPIVIADRVRDQLLHGTPLREVHESRWTDAYEAGFHERVYTELVRRAEAVLQSGRAVVLDGCFARRKDRDTARSLARRYGVPFRFIEMRIEDATRRARLAERDAAEARAGWREIAKDLADDWESTRHLPEDELDVLDGTRPIALNLARIEPGLPAWPDPTRPGAPVPLRRSGLSRRPRVVTFDCWNTLIYEADWGRAHARRVAALERAAREAGRRTTREEASAAFDAGWAHQMACWRDGLKAGAREVAIHALRELDLLEPHPALEHLIREYEEASHSGRVLAIDGARECLASLEREGIRRALICDTGLTPGRVVRQHLDGLGLLEYLEICIFSDEIGAPKPDERVFRAALTSLGEGPDRAIHVGDLRRTDVAGARAFGMGTVRIRAQHDDQSELPEADAVVNSHADLLETVLSEPFEADPAPVSRAGLHKDHAD